MNSVNLTPISQLRLSQVADPFMRKNQIWFQKSLPPAIESQQTFKKSKNHLEQMALNLLNPKHIDRTQLSPNHYKNRLNALQDQLHRTSNQLPQGNAVLTLLHQESELINLFNDNRLTSVPC